MTSLLIATWTATGAVVGLLMGFLTRPLLRAPARHPTTLKIIGIAATAAAFGLLSWRLGNIVDLLAYSIVAAAGVPLATIDALEQRLPTTLLYPTITFVAALLAASAFLTHNGSGFLRALAGMAALTGFYLLLALISSGGLGAGDVKLGALLGLVLTWTNWTTLLMGTLLGWILSILTWLIYRVIRPTSQVVAHPVGPSLLFGAVLTAITFHTSP